MDYYTKSQYQILLIEQILENEEGGNTRFNLPPNQVQYVACMILLEDFNILKSKQTLYKDTRF